MTKFIYFYITAPYCRISSFVLISFQAIKISKIPNVPKIYNKIRYPKFELGTCESL